MAKIYRVEMDGALLVVATSSLNAQELAKLHMTEIIDSGSFMARFNVREMSKKDKQFFKSVKDVVPYNTASLTASVDNWIDDNTRQQEYAEYLRLQTMFSGS